jgi:outer membrane cobalamin receptor
MQKFYPGSKHPLWSLFNLKMKLTIALLFFSNLLIYAGPSSGQSMHDVKISLFAKDMTIKDVIGLIEKRSDFVIGYKNMEAMQHKKITVDIKGKSIAAILNDLMAPGSIDVKQISDKYIIISPKRNLEPTMISGVIKDKRTGETIPGVSIKVKGTVIGTQSDIDGQYSISIREDRERFTLVVSYIGYKSQEFDIARSATKINQNVQLEEDRLGLDEVVVTGQGIDVSKRRLSTNVVSISGADIEKTPGTRIDQLLQSKLPNAQIRLTGGQAGSTSIIRARGVVSAFMNSTPVIYVDGVRMDNLNTPSTLGGGAASGAGVSALADIPMDNIEKIEYINGGAATTLYGSDAANGVIQIITKKGGSERTAITFNAEVGPETSTNDFLHFNRTKDLLFETGTFQKYNVGVNGSKGGIGYSFTGGYMNSSGVQIEDQNANQRIDMRSGFRANIGDKVTYESSFTFVNNSYKRSRNGNQGGYTGLWFLESGASKNSGPLKNPMIDDLSEADFQVLDAYVRDAERMQDNEIVVNRFQTSQTFNYRPLESLVFKAVGGIDYRTVRNKVITTNEYITHTTGNLSTAGGSISNADRKYWGLTMEVNGQHKAEFGDFSFITTFGGQLFRNEDRQVAYNGTNVRDGMRDIRTVGTTTAGEIFTEVVNYGVYLQENLGFKNKFFIDLGLRGDGNSAFGKDVGVQYYPKVGFAYVPTAESWVREAVPFVSSAKLRGSYGLAGNFPPPFMNDRTIGFSSYLGALGASFGTPELDLRPEKTATLEAGLDLGLLQDRIVFSAGFYHSITTDALFQVPATPSTGEAAAIRNVGKILNRGLEFSLNATPVRTKDISLSFNLSVNTLHNNVLSSMGSAPFNLNGFSERTIQTVVQEGFPVGFIRGGYGVFDANGVYDPSQSKPLQYLGTTIPDLFGSMGLNFQFKDFNFFANGDYQSGASASNWDKQFRFNYGAGNEGIPQGEIDKNKRVNWLNFTNMFIEKTDFIKVRTIGASYLFRGPNLGKAIKNLTVGFSVVNPLNFSSSSFDPENTTSGSAQGQGRATTGGVSYATYSAPRQFLGSVKVNF